MGYFRLRELYCIVSAIYRDGVQVRHDIFLYDNDNII